MTSADVEEHAQRARELLERRLGDAAAREIDDVVRARREGAEHEPPVARGAHELGAVAVAERARRRDTGRDPYAGERGVRRERAAEPARLPGELGRDVEVLQHAAAARPERRAGGRAAVGRGLDDVVEARPGLGPVRRHVRHRRGDALARQRGRDVDARAGVCRQPRALVVEIVARERQLLAITRRRGRRAGVGRRHGLAASAPTAAASSGNDTS